MRVRGEAVVSVLSHPVVPLPALPVGIDVNHDSAEVRQVVEKLVADLLRDLVTVSHRQPPGHRDAHLRVEAMPDPPRSDIGDLFHPGNVTRCVANRLQRLRVDSVEHPDHDGPSRLPDDHEDGRRDEQTYDRVGQRVAGPDSDGAEEDRQARPTIHARVVAVGDQGDAADLPTDPDPEDGDGFVADEADDGGEHHGPEKTDRLRVEKPLARLVEREQRALTAMVMTMTRPARSSTRPRP